MSNQSHKCFVERTREEVNRAERYCLYLSLIVVDISDFARVAANRGNKSKDLLDSICSQLGDGIRQVVRASDVVSCFENNKLGLLLAETSSPGLDKVTARVRSFVLDFLQGQSETLPQAMVSVKAASFPEEVTAFSQLATGFAIAGQPVH